LSLTKKHIRNFSGHVYTIQSHNGWYSVTPAQIIVKNCRCYPEPVLDLSDVSWPHRVYRAGTVSMMTRAAFARAAGMREAA
jgi:hypothetical protein